MKFATKDAFKSNSNVIKSFMSKFLPHYPTVGYYIPHLTRLKFSLYDITKRFCHRLRSGREGGMEVKRKEISIFKHDSKHTLSESTPLAFSIREGVSRTMAW